MSLSALDDPDARVSFIVCPVCGHEDTLSWWLSKTIPEGADLAPAESVIAFVSLRTAEVLTHAQLRQWATRGFVKRHGRDEKGRTLYSSNAVLAYAKDQIAESEAA